MTSKISTPDKKSDNNRKTRISLLSLLREDLRHRTWMIALSLLGSFVASPVAFLFFNDGLYRLPRYRMISVPVSPQEIAKALAEEICQYLTDGHLLFQMVILMFGAVIVACAGFRHLYVQKMTDLYHSTPVTRKSLFLSGWLSGFLTWFVPFLLGNLCVYAMALYKIGIPAYWGGMSAILLQEILLCTLCFLIVYNACLVPVMISGNMTNALVNLLIYGLIVFSGYTTVIEYMHYYLRTFYHRDALYSQPLVMGLAPLATPIFLGIQFVSGIPMPVLTIVLSVLVLAANFYLAMRLYAKRPSELAERGLESKWFRIPLRFIVSLQAGLLLSQIFAAASGMGAWALFGAVFGTALAFALCNVIFHAGFKYVLEHKRQFLLCLACVCATLGVFKYDVFGFDRRLPDASQITGLSLYCSWLTDDSYWITHYRANHSYNTEPPADFQFTDADAIYTLLDTLVNPPSDYSGMVSTINVRVDTTHGSYYRSYGLYNCQEFGEALAPILRSDCYRDYFYPASREDWELPERISADSLNDCNVTIEDPERIRELHAAYRRDFLEHYSPDNIIIERGDLSLNYRYRIDDIPHDAYLHIGKDYRETIALLEEWYPDLIWSTEKVEYSLLQLSFTTWGGTQEALYSYFGLPNPEPEAQETASEDEAMSTYIWKKEISDPDEIAKWKPYLILRNSTPFFREEDFDVIVGYVQSSGGARFNCYVEWEKLPPELLADLTPRRVE